MARLLFLLLTLLFTGLLPTISFAQKQIDQSIILSANQLLDNVAQQLSHSDQTLHAPETNDAQLLTLRSTLDQFPSTLQSVIDDMSSRLEMIQNRLDQLGSPPPDKTVMEDKDLAAQRQDLLQQNKAIDAVIKRARLLSVELNQTQDNITSRRRQIFTHTLFGHSLSIVDPSLWLSVSHNLPFEYRSLSYLLSNYYTQIIASKSAADIRFLLSLLCLPIIFFFAAAQLYSRLMRRLRHRYANPSYPQQLWHALWTALCLFTIPVFTALIVLSIITNYDLVTDHNNALLAESLTSTLRFSIIIALSTVLLSPQHSEWRLLRIDDISARLIHYYIISITSLITLGRLIESSLDVIAASLSITIAIKGILAFGLAVMMVKMLRAIAYRLNEDECLGPRIENHRHILTILRLILWSCCAALFVSGLTGFIAFSSFLIDQLIWDTILASLLFLSLEFIEKIILASFTANSHFTQIITSTFGVRRESIDVIAVVLSGLSTLILSVIFLLLALAPWGVESDGMLGTLKAAYFGFKVGDITISLSDIGVALIIFFIGLLATRSLQNWFDKKFLPHTQLDIGLGNSIRTSLGYLGFFAASSFALVQLGLNFEKLAIVAGALSVGIGFGLQSIVNNFVSGLILLWERAIRVGDWIVVGDEQGYVKRINVRSTEIETFDRATMIVPNSNLVTGTVKNWVRSDRIGRIKVLLSVGIHTNPDDVRDLLLACASEHDLVLKIPAPQVVFSAMTDTGLKFELVCFVSDVEASSRTKSDLHFEIFRRFKAAGLEILTGGPPAPTRITIEGLHEIIERTSR